MTISTLLLITRDRLVRADLRPGREGGLAACSAESRPAVDDLPSLVEAALRLSRRRPGRVWILSTDFWTQTLALSAEAIAGLKQDEIGRALRFEAEPFSGVNALEAATAHVALPGHRDQPTFWLTAVSTNQLEQIEYVVEQAGGRLAGISHPGGLPHPLSPELAGSADWQRVELWPNAIVCLRAENGQRPTVFVRNADPRPGRWEADVQRWQAEAVPPPLGETLHGTSAVAVDELETDRRLVLDQTDAAETFLRAWAEELATGGTHLPLIRPPKRPMSVGARRGLAVVFGLIGLVICTGHYLLTQHQKRSLEAETARLKKPIEELQQAKKKAEELQGQTKKLQDETEELTADLEHYRQVMQGQRQGLSALLDTLAQQASERMFIQKIERKDEDVVLRGVCLEPELASGLAHALAESLGPLGWHVQPPSRNVRDSGLRGGLADFEVRIRDVASTSAGQSATRATTASGRRQRAAAQPKPK